MQEKKSIPFVPIFSLIFTFFWVGPCTAKVKALQSYDQMKILFKNPPAEYRTVPFWVWNNQVNKKQIDSQLVDFKRKGIGGLFIHPRYGLINPYLSAEWFDLVHYAVEIGKSMGLQIWLYDENSYPSGFAGGHVPAVMPESYSQGQGLVLEKCDTLPSDAAQRYVVFLKKDSAGISEISPLINSGKGIYYLFKKVYYEKTKWFGNWSYVDLLFPGVTEKFIELTMTGYEQTIGKEFGKNVPGIFTDEPHIDSPDRKRSIRWTPDLFEQFQKRKGYNLKSKLPSLFEETGDWKHIRFDYQSVLLELFIERWAKPWYGYSDTHGLSWTGHYWEHEWPNPSRGPDNMAMYSWFHIPGIDMLFNTFDEDRPVQFGNVRAVKELASVANQLDKKRTLSETYGAAGWELRFEDMKRLGDWEYVLGVNLMNQHLSYSSLIGDRKHDFPQSFSYHEPWWNLYKPLADYFGRLSLVLSSGEQNNRILVIEPTTTAWMYQAPGSPEERITEIKNSFQSFLDELENNQIEYDLGSEYLFKDSAKIEGNRWIVGERTYDRVILPPGMENMETHTYQLIEQFLRQHGKLYSFTKKPFTIGGVVSGKANRLPEMYPRDWVWLSSVEETKSDWIHPDFEILAPEKIQGKLFHQRRYLIDGQIVFLVNSSLEKSAAGIFTAKGTSAVELDAMNGEQKLYPVIQKNNRIQVSFDLPPAESLLLLVRSLNTKAIPQIASHNFKRINPIGKIKVQATSQNVLTLDYCDLKLGDVEEKGIYFYAASDKIFKHHGFTDNPWVSSSQYRTGILDRDHFSKESGFDVHFPFYTENGVDLSSLQLVVERPNLWQVHLNQKIIQPEKNTWWLDRDFAVYKIGSYVKVGENSVTLSVHPMSIFAELEPVYIIGYFNVESQNKGWKIMPASQLDFGGWKIQGLPFYPYGVSYKNSFKNSKQKSYLLKLSKWNGTVADININGKSAGIIGWPPYELDISKNISEGINEIAVIVYGSLKNLLGPHHNVTRRGIVTPWSFKYAPQVQPPGEKYDLIEYGLFEEFQVLESKTNKSAANGGESDASRRRRE